MIINRIWAMPNGNTFTIKPIKELLQRYIIEGEVWVDPFANNAKVAQITNDLNCEYDTTYHMDALAFLEQLADGEYDGVVFDPPYSITQATQLYKDFGKDKLKIHVSNMKYWAEVKNNISRILKPNGKVICCGWTSMGLGLNRKFEMVEILLVPHGGSKNDTIVTVEFKR